MSDIPHVIAMPPICGSYFVKTAAIPFIPHFTEIRRRELSFALTLCSQLTNAINPIFTTRL